MPRKCIVKIVLIKEQKGILDDLATRPGISESETLWMTLMNCAKELSLARETIHRTAADLMKSKGLEARKF